MRVDLRIRKEPAYRREAFERGLRAIGFKVENNFQPIEPSDWLVVWNKKQTTGGAPHSGSEAECDEWERRGGTVIVCENGYLAQVDKTYYAISVHGHNGSGWFPQLDDDRFSKLGFTLKLRPIDSGKQIVVRGQRGIGSKLMASPANWARMTAAQIRQTGSPLPVTVYDHPGDKGKYERDVAMLRDAHSLVVWSSAMGVRALVEGVPLMRMAPHWVCANAVPRATTIGPVYPTCMPTIDERRDALDHMAHGQWHFDEIASGEPFARIIEHRAEAVWP